MRTTAYTESCIIPPDAQGSGPVVDRQTEPFDPSVDLMIRHLRQRLRDGAREPHYIETQPNEGGAYSASVEHDLAV